MYGWPGRIGGKACCTKWVGAILAAHRADGECPGEANHPGTAATRTFGGGM